MQGAIWGDTSRIGAGETQTPSAESAEGVLLRERSDQGSLGLGRRLGTGAGRGLVGGRSRGRAAIAAHETSEHSKEKGKGENTLH